MKIKFNSILLLAIILTGILSVSCKKEQSPNDQNEIPANDIRLANMIKNFKAKGESGLKTTAEMTIDSAIWYIGATTNFTYGDGSRETEKTWTDSIFISLPVSNGKISESEVFSKYQIVIDSLSSIYQAKIEENKQLLAITIQTHSLSTSALVCKVTGVFAYGYPVVPITFNSIDSWSFCKDYNNGGICDGSNYGTHPESDAAIETQKRIMYSKAVPAGNYWYEPLPNNEGIIKIEDPTQYPIPTVPQAPPNNYHYAYLYWNSSQFHNPDINGCIPPVDLNFYLVKTKELIYNDTQHNGIRPVGSSFINITMWGDLIEMSQYQIYTHKAVVNYGILHVSPFPYIDLPF